MSSLFFERIEDPAYGTYFMPTAWGYTLFAIILIALLLLASALTDHSSRRLNARKLAFCSVTLALAYVTSTFIKLIHMPMGGSITLFSMLFVCLAGYWYGLRVGLITAVAYGLLQLVTNPWIISLPQLLFDYILAFGALGFSGLFSNSKKGLIKGYLAGVGGRLLFSFISGMAFFASSASEYNLSVPMYSLLYNGAYIGGEALLTVILLMLPPVSGALQRIKNEAL